MLGHHAHDRLGQVCTSRTVCYADRNGRPLAEGDLPLPRVIETGKPNTSTLLVQHADGQWIDVELQSVPLFDQAGHLHGVAQIFQDKSRNGRVTENRELKMAASRDALTGVANRGELERQLEVMVSQYSQLQHPEPFSLIFLDIDFFKSINDTFGHAAGDQVLVDLSRLLQHEVYSGELIARYGGEEFVILCPGTDLDQAFRRAERLRKAISSTQVGNLNDHRVTSSFGVTAAEPGDTTASLLSRADKALYISKETGRDRTTLMTIDTEQNETDAIDCSTAGTPDPFLVTDTFKACTTAEMVVYKLAGFVDEYQARLDEVTPERVTMQVGQLGLIPFWGNRDEKRPVSLEIVFGDDGSANSDRPSKTSLQTTVTVSVRPIGRIRDAQVFERRARSVLKTLRSFFVASPGS